MFRSVAVPFLLTVTLGATIPKAVQKSPGEKAVFPSGRIVNGDDVDISEVPWQVALEFLNHYQYCAGFIISENYVLTAAHCTASYIPAEIKIRTGTSIRSSGGTLVRIKNFFFHPKWEPEIFECDICILELAEPIQFNENSQPIRLTDREPQGGEMVRISGWGDTTEQGESSLQLQTAFIPVIDKAVCAQDYRNHNVTEAMFCADTSIQSSCQGDSGGAAVLNGAAAGITSWAVGCAEEGFPGVYTNIADPKILQFIHEHTDI